MPAQITTFRDSVFSGITRFLNFVPTLVGALIVLIIGWFIASLVARLVERILISLKLDQLSAHTGLDQYMIGPRGRYHASYGVGVLTKWFIRLIFLQAAANLLQMPQITAILNRILLYIPNVAVAILILVLGAYLARFTSSFVQQATAKAGMNRPDLFSLITRYAIMGFAVIAALNHLGVAVMVVNTLLIGLVASLALALGLSFGLGGQGVASEVTRMWYEQGKSSRLKAVPSSPSSSAPASSQSTQAPGQTPGETKKTA